MPTRYLVTAALPYINGIKHLGNLIGSMLPADVYARFRRLEGHEVLFVCATDEHGTPAELAAAEAGLSPADYCAAMHARQAEIYARLGLSFDHFGRTSHPFNHALTQDIYRDLKARDRIEVRPLTQLWSEADGRFLPDRYVVGTCPRCGASRARGDQCEACAAVLDPKDLIDARSALSGSRDLEPRASAHVFLRLGALAEEVGAWVAAAGGAWGEMTRSIAHKWLNEGLRDRCISRDLAWGVPVPEASLSGKVFYVWFDAPMGYLSATREWAERRGEPEAWRRWWCPEEAGGDTVELSQFMAKDNVPFHTVMFPAMLLGGGRRYRMADRIKGFNWLTYYGGKFSTSMRRGIFLDDALALFDADVWRYALLVQAPEGRDGAFTWEEFARRVNKDLNDSLGNFVHRALSFIATRFGPEVPQGGAPGAEEEALGEALARRARALAGHLAAHDFRRAAEELRDAWGDGNLYIDQAAPWKVFRESPERAAMVLRTCVNAMATFAGMMSPLMPHTADKLARALCLPAPPDAPWRGQVDLGALAPGHPLAPPPPLFAKIDAERVAELTLRFGGAGGATA